MRLWPKWYRPPGQHAALTSELVSEVAKAFDIDPTALTSPNRFLWTVDARATVVGILRSRGMSFPGIGRVIKRDSSTVQHIYANLPMYQKRNPIIGATMLRLHRL